MASNSHNRGNDENNFSANHSIPLQDFSQPFSQPPDVATEEEHGRGRPGSARDGFFSRRSRRRGGGSLRNYARVAEGSPIDTTAATRHPVRHVPGSSDDIVSPVEDPGTFAQAMSSFGLHFDGPSQSRESFTSDLGTVPLDNFGSHDPDPYFPSADAYEDTAPLTDQAHLQPISGGPGSDNRSHDEQHGSHAVHFTDDDHTGSRLGDDLPHLETGLGGVHRRRGSSGAGSRSRSLSPSASGSALQRASTMMKSMSQRVVNLSNEPEVVEQSILREESYKNSRMEEPPALPAMPDYAHDSSSPSPDGRMPRGKLWRVRNNPLRGRSLGIIDPDNPIRVRLCDVLVHPFTEPFILFVIVIQTILLTIDSATTLAQVRWGQTAIDLCNFVIFIIYTLELIAKVIVSGLLFNPAEYSTLDRSLGFRQAVAEKGKNLITPHRQFSTKKASVIGSSQPQASILRTFTGGLNQLGADVVDDPLQQRRVRLAHRAFLRHSFNRLDFVAVVSFWTSFSLSLAGAEEDKHIYVFRMMSCLRILRLLSLTNGTSIILRSLKKAAPLLVHVAFLIGFFWLLFAIVGIQSFKSSFRRTCVWKGVDGQEDFALDNPYNNLQFCGGYLDNNGTKRPWVRQDDDRSKFSPKGYICPQGSKCIEGTNPYNGTMSFDNILHSLELVFVIMSSNTFTDLLYWTTDSDYLATSLFFICGLIILSLWLVNLLVAVITHTFQVIREESKRSAFAVQNLDAVEEEETSKEKASTLKRLYSKTEWLWVCIIVFGLVVQALRSASMGEDRKKFISDTETTVTIVLLIEIILRFACDWRNFHKKRRNLVDLGLAIITCVIQIPPISNSDRPYAVLTLFQILRVYRVVLAFSATRNLITTVFSNATGLLNLIVFVFLITFIAAIFATQLFRGQFPTQDPGGNEIEITFSNIYNSFLGMYQVLSSENWTKPLYNATLFTLPYGSSWISTTFLVLWFILANFIVLNMFIAVIQESFDVSEDEKRLHQVRAFLEQKQVHGQSQGNLSLSTIFKLGRDTDRYRDPLDHGPAALEMLLKDAVVREFLDEQDFSSPAVNRRRESIPPDSTTAETVQPGLVSRTWMRAKTSIMRREPNPFYSKLKFSRAYEELDPKTMAKEVVSAAEQRKRAQREYLVRHPSYNKSLFIFTPGHPLRKLCQRIVGPGRGHQRVEGVDPYKPAWYAFSAFIYAAIVAMVVIACVTTPIYQREHIRAHQSWFVFTDIGFAIVFSIEGMIKVIADGFFWTPNAYFRGSWGFIDGIVLVTLWISIISTLKNDLGISRAIGAFKALRALRLLNVSDSAKNTFHSVIIVGGWKVISAALVSISFLIPFAIYGVNLFNGQMVLCNDQGFSGTLANCVNEWSSSPSNWNVLAPRSAANPYYNFDDFGNSLFILFQIVSQEGWIDVQNSAMSIQGQGQQPQQGAKPENGLFFVVFNLLGSVFVLTLFVSVFMRNYTEQTGVAFLTAEQRSWLELRKLLRQISPSKRSLDRKVSKWKQWCYRVAVKKHGRWARFVTGVLLLHLLLLVLEFYPEPSLWEWIRAGLFFFFTIIYLVNVMIRMGGLGWHRFTRSSWDLYSLLSVPGTLVTTILNFLFPNTQVIVEMNKLFLVSITLLLIPRNNQLDQLFKTAAASFTAIGNLLATWFVLFLVYAIAMNQTFGLTKFGSEGTNNLNFRDIPRSLILLFRMSCGEGWNQIMEDFANMTPPHCTYDDDFLNDDCGSAAWARALFISWNLISMYIFVSLFVSLIFESFSYVYQRSSGLYVISREEIRRFKQAWATYDPDGTGFISKEQFPRLLGELSGIFAMRIHDDEFSTERILEQCRVDERDTILPEMKVVEGVDIDKLSKILRELPLETIRARRRKLNVFYEEVLVSADPVRGISFHSCLMILCHYNVISDSKSLRLEEFLRRRSRLQRVEEAVRRNTVIGFFDTLYWSRQFRRNVHHKKSGRMSVVPQFSVPEIFVDGGEYHDDEENVARAAGPQEIVVVDNGEASTPMLSPVSHSRGNSSPTAMLGNLPRIDTALASGHLSGASTPTEWSSFSPSASPRRERAHTTSSYGDGPHEPSETQVTADHSRQNSAVSDVMQSLDNSAWGESIRRSFTQRRSN